MANKNELPADRVDLGRASALTLGNGPLPVEEILGSIPTGLLADN